MENIFYFGIGVLFAVYLYALYWLLRWGKASRESAWEQPLRYKIWYEVSRYIDDQRDQGNSQINAFEIFRVIQQGYQPPPAPAPAPPDDLEDWFRRQK